MPLSLSKVSSDETTQSTRNNSRDSDDAEVHGGAKRPRQHTTRRTSIALSALSTVLLLALVTVVVVENKVPQSILARWLRKSSCDSKGRKSLQLSQQSTIATGLPVPKQRRKRQRRRLEEADEDQQEEEGEEDNQGEQENEEENDEENQDNNNNNDNGDDNNNENEDDGEEDEQDSQEEEEAQNQNQDDDYYSAGDDNVAADDAVQGDDAEAEEEEEEETEAPTDGLIDDDFYAFQEDPGPPRLFPLSSWTVAAYVLASCGLTLGASGGIGGGGIVVPVYILVAGLTPKMAIPLGAVTVLGGSVASTTVNAKRRHPLADRPIIDWDLVLVTEPLTLIGTLMGTLLHRVMSEKILIVLLVLLLSVSAHSTLAKAKRMHDAESRYIKKLKAAHSHDAHHHHVHVPPLSPVEKPRIGLLPSVHKARPSPTIGGVYFAPGSPTTIPSNPNGALLSPPTFAQTTRTDEDCFSNMTIENQNDVTTIEPDTSWEDDDMMKIQKTLSEASTPRQMGTEERQQILILNPDFITLRSGLLEEEKFTPRSKIIALCLMFSILMFLNIMIGGGAFPSPWGIRCGSVAFWVVQVIMVAFLVASAWAAQTYLINRHEMKEIVRFDYVHGDIKWDARSAVIYPALFICAGIFAGMFGIGGGMITVPLMLTMGVHPGVVSATSSAMILFTSFASATSYLVFGLILYDYALLCFFVGFFASLFGNKVMRQARQAKSANGRNFERNSYIAFVIGGVILLSSLLMTVDYIFRVYSFDTDEAEGLCEGYRI